MYDSRPYGILLRVGGKFSVGEDTWRLMNDIISLIIRYHIIYKGCYLVDQEGTDSWYRNIQVTNGIIDEISR